MKNDFKLGLKLKRIRTGKEITLSRLAESSGVTTSFISQVERGLVSPSIDSLRRISLSLGVDIADFFRAGVEAAPLKGAARKIVTDRETRSSCEEVINTMPGIIRPLKIKIYGGGRVKEEMVKADDNLFAVVLEGRVVIVCARGDFSLNIIKGGNMEISCEEERLVLGRKESFYCKKKGSLADVFNPFKEEAELLWICGEGN
jgi:transcriptional regulator with XRE-family HTH domain